jgi:hypothetical protein
MKINKLYIVTHPRPYSTMGDIFFETDVKGLELQFLGGLKATEIYGVYVDKDEANVAAAKVMTAYQNYQKQVGEALNYDCRTVA